MAAFLIQLLIAVCLCVISSRCQEDRIFCSEDSLTEITVYAVPQNNEINCWRHFHGEGATYSWSRYHPSQRGYYPIPVNSNVTISGSILRFNYSSINVGFKCDIQKANNEDTGPIVYRVIQSMFIHYYPNDPAPDVVLRSHESISIKCPITYYYVGDELSIKWYRYYDQIKKPIIQTQRVYIDERGNLNFSPVSYNDHLDKLLCELSAPRLGVRIEAPNITLRVLQKDPNYAVVKPLLMYKSPNVQARINDNITLECVFSNNDDNRFGYIWYQPSGKEVGSTAEHFAWYSGQKLYLEFMQTSYTGYWYCGADNLSFESFRQGIYVLVTC